MSAISHEQIVLRVLAEAEKLRKESDQTGEQGDRGAGQLKMQAVFYNHGMKSRLPPEWEQYADELAQESDPEYLEYQRLKAKFNKA